MTDEHQSYKEIGREFISHDSVNHSLDEYVRGTVHTNTVEGFYSIIKRGMKGVYQNCAEKHLHCYIQNSISVTQTASHWASTTGNVQTLPSTVRLASV
jgi:hypothetical protein